MGNIVREKVSSYTSATLEGLKSNQPNVSNKSAKVFVPKPFLLYFSLLPCQESSTVHVRFLETEKAEEGLQGQPERAGAFQQKDPGGRHSGLPEPEGGADGKLGRGILKWHVATG